MMKRQQRRRAGFTLIEVLTAILIVVILAAILIPAVISVKRSAVAVQCMNNMKQIAAAIQIYSNDNNDAIVPVGYHDLDQVLDPLLENWVTCLTLAPGKSYLEVPNAQGVAQSDDVPGKSVFTCPAVNAGRNWYWQQDSLKFRDPNVAGNKATSVRTDYGINGTHGSDAGNDNGEARKFPARMWPVAVGATAVKEIRGISTVPTSSTMVLLFEGRGFPVQSNVAQQVGYPQFLITAPHGKQNPKDPDQKSGTCNIAFFDGHVEQLARAELPRLVFPLDASGNPDTNQAPTTNDVMDFGTGYNATNPHPLEKLKTTRWRLDVQPGG
jgi:prepilin-type N-terminal cleavage/methylation domain-containing protein/prepilin-type processing-associated H-X9-DG protein